MNTSAAKVIVGSNALQEMQVNFLRWAVKWMHNQGNSVELPDSAPDLPNLVVLLQSLGYKIRRMDSCDPKEVTPLAEGERGTRIVLSCCHSGQRCYLEHPQSADNCTCSTKLNNDSQDSFWQVTATTNTSRCSSVIETGSDLIPAISKELTILMKNVVGHLLSLIQANDSRRESLSSNSSVNRILTHISHTSSPKPDAKRFSGYVAELDAGSEREAPVEEFRYGSLDTLINQKSNTLKTPTGLPPPVKVSSSPSIAVQKEQKEHKEESGNSSSSTLDGGEIEKIMVLLQKAVASIRQVSDAISGKKLSDTFVRESKPDSYKKVSTLKVAPKPPARPYSFTNSQGATRVKCRIPASPTTSVPNRKPTPKSSVAKKPGLYAHVKSTIPKPYSTKKKGDE